jgi:hypothetical protein
MRDGDRKTFSPEGGNVHVHVWFDQDKYARDDFGNRNDNAYEWQVIISTSPDPLNMKPRGRELARETFRYVEDRARSSVAASAQSYIKRMLFKHR